MTLSHDVAGDGPAVLLLHSGVCDRRMWDPQWSALLAAGHRVVRCDLRGFGDTPLAAKPYDNAADVIDLLDHLDMGEVALVGASFGGAIALDVASRSPERVTALALLCTAFPGHEAGPETRAFGEREDELIESGDIAGAVELNVSTWLGPEADDATRDQVRHMQRHAFDVQLDADPAASPAQPVVDPAAIEARCLAVSGAHDLPDFRQIAARIPELVPGTRHIELDWAGHLPSLERPDETSDLLVGFLAGRIG